MNNRVVYGLMAMFFISSSTWAAKAKDSMTFVSPSDEAEAMSVGQARSMFFGLGVSSIVPFSTPFLAKAGSSGSKEFRYEIPNNIRLELGFQKSKTFEVALSVGAENYDTRYNVGSTNNLNFQKISLRYFPVELVGRFLLKPNSIWRPEVQFGLGLAFGTTKISIDNNSLTAIEESSHPFRFHLAGGFGIPWTDSISLHIQLGYAMTLLGSKTYYSGIAGADRIAQSNFSGIFAQGQMKFLF